MHHDTERVTHLQQQPSGHLAEVAWPGEGGEPEGCAGLGAVSAPPCAIRPSAEEEAAGERTSRPLQGWLICWDSARAARLSRGQIRDLREGSGRPHGHSRPTFPDSLGSMAPLSVARADPATASRPSPPPRGPAGGSRGRDHLGDQGPGRGGLPGEEGARASPTSGGR